MKAFFTREFFGIPVYAYAVGLGALVLGVWYFKKRTNTQAATQLPQTVTQPSDLGVTYPYPSPGSSGSEGRPNVPPPMPPNILPHGYGSSIPGIGAGPLPGQPAQPWQPWFAGAGMSGGPPDFIGPVNSFVLPRPQPTPSQIQAWRSLQTTRTLPTGGFPQFQ